MALTWKQSQLIRSTIPLLQSDGDRVTEIFYQSLLAAHPELRHIYNPTNQTTRRQPRAFTAAILTFAQYAGLDTSTLAAKLERVCQKHCSLGIKPHHYPIVGEVLLRAFGDVLGPERWTKEIHAAWHAAYGILSRMLIGRERTLYAEFGHWEDWRSFKVVKRVNEDPQGNVVSFYLAPQDGGKLPRYLPGQYVTVQLWVPTANCFQSRQYALSDAWNEDYYRITIQRDRGAQSVWGATSSAGAAVKCPVSGHSAAAPTPASSPGATPSAASSAGSHCPFFIPGPALSSPAALASPTGSRPPSRGRPGIMSNLLIDHRRTNDAIDIAHPAGEFYLDPSNTSSLPLVLISAGIGAAPLLAIFNTVTATQPDRCVSWIHGRSLPGEGGSSPTADAPTTPFNPPPAIFEEHVRRVAATRKGVRVDIVDSPLAGADTVSARIEAPRREQDRTRSLQSGRSSESEWEIDTSSMRSGNEGSAGAAGRGSGGVGSDDDLFWSVDGADLWLGNSGTEYLVCGPEAFMQGVAKALKARGVRAANVRFELLGTGDFHFGW